MPDQEYLSYGEQHPLLAHFRRELRRLRLEHGWTQAALVARLEGWTEDTVSHIEVGRRDPTPTFAAACDRVFQTRDKFQRLVKDAGVGEDEDGFSDWIDVERLAVTLRTWEPLVMPGLLQTGLYARAISEVWQAVDGDFDPDRYAAERLKRQEIFDRQPPPSFGAVIAESVLHTPVGGPPVMRGQLKHYRQRGRVRQGRQNFRRAAYRCAKRAGQPGEDGKRHGGAMAGVSDRRKSSYSGGPNTNCVAVGATERGAYVEDAKQDRQPGARTRLSVPARAWQEFTSRIKSGRLG